MSAQLSLASVGSQGERPLLGVTLTQIAHGHERVQCSLVWKPGEVWLPRCFFLYLSDQMFLMSIIKSSKLDVSVPKLQATGHFGISAEWDGLSSPGPASRGRQCGCLFRYDGQGIVGHAPTCQPWQFVKQFRRVLKSRSQECVLLCMVFRFLRKRNDIKSNKRYT